jgi:Ca2+-binding EF-hand superfamily protein
VAAAMDMDQLLTNSKLKQAFEMFDEDGSGVISADAIKSVLGLASDPTMNEKIN